MSNLLNILLSLRRGRSNNNDAFLKQGRGLLRFAKLADRVTKDNNIRNEILSRAPEVIRFHLDQILRLDREIKRIKRRMELRKDRFKRIGCRL